MTILKKQHPFLSLIRENILAVLFFLFLVLVIWIGLENLSTSTQSEQLIATDRQCAALQFNAMHWKVLILLTLHIWNSIMD